jgi:hypothetical protein
MLVWRSESMHRMKNLYPLLPFCTPPFLITQPSLPKQLINNWIKGIIRQKMSHIRIERLQRMRQSQLKLINKHPPQFLRELLGYVSPVLKAYVCPVVFELDYEVILTLDDGRCVEEDMFTL